MKCQFVKDNTNTIWLQRAFGIVSRPSHPIQKRRAKFLDVDDSVFLKAGANIVQNGQSQKEMNVFEKQRERDNQTVEKNKTRLALEQ